ncbi:MAG: tRNA (adenosine(37)-N6)-threonylcarbamoyltransferase complex ATPase subunit type 1 TsaE [Thermoguttaceae bacterium]
MKHFSFIAADEKDTARLGGALSEYLTNGTVVCLCGTLGAGKTRLVQAVAEGLGIERREVVSPTFVLIKEYQGRKKLFHIDAYRLRDEDEFLALGADEYLESDGVVFIEWAERVVGCLPSERVEINIEVLGKTRRQFEITSIGEKYLTLVSDLASSLADR